MTRRIFFISDTHFSHKNICKFLTADGNPVRPWDCPDEMDEVLVDNWNKAVRQQDKVYHLGDVVINHKALSIMSRLNGSKRLVRGNHDVFPTKEYLLYFKEIYGVRVLTKYNLVLSHIPLHIDSVRPRFGFNIHGHLHQNVIDHPAYINVSVERINYTPISLEEIMEIQEARKNDETG